MVETNNDIHRFVMENKDEYVYYKNDNEWILRLYDIEHPNGKFIVKSRYESEILSKIPS